MSKLLPIAGIDKAATITNALLVKLCLEQGKTLEQSIKVVNDSYSPVGCFSHSDGYKGNSCVALINGNVVVFAQLDSPKHPLKPSRWNGAQIVRLKTTEMTDEEKKLFGIDKLNIKRSEIPAVTHVDYSARIQTVNKNYNKRYYDLISKFKEKTGCPVIVNTSFNVRGEPIVNSPTDAFNCFMGTELDFLVIGDCILDKKKQNQNLKKDYTKEFELD